MRAIGLAVGLCLATAGAGSALAQDGIPAGEERAEILGSAAALLEWLRSKGYEGGKSTGA